MKQNWNKEEAPSDVPLNFGEVYIFFIIFPFSFLLFFAMFEFFDVS